MKQRGVQEKSSNGDSGSSLPGISSGTATAAAVDALSKKVDRTQRMAMLLGFSLSFAALLFLIGLARQEILAEGHTSALRTLTEKIQEVQDQQRLQSMALSRIGGFMTKMVELQNEGKQ